MPPYNFPVSFQQANVLEFGAVGDGIANDVSAIQDAVDSLGTTGGVVYFTPGKTYYLETDWIKIPAGITGRLVLWGYGATLKMGVRKALAFNSLAAVDHQVFQNTMILGFKIDGNNVPDVTGVTPIGNSQSSRCNMENILIRDIHITNLKYNATGSQCGGIVLKTWQAAAGEGTQNYLRDILIDNVRVEGGNAGVVVAGILTIGVSGANIYMDNVTVQNWYHDTGVVPTGAVGDANVQIGGAAQGERITVRNGQGFNSADVGVEVNAFDHPLVENVTIQDCYNICFYHTNYNRPVTPTSQHVVFRGVHGKRINIAAGKMFQFNRNTNALGDISLEDCSWFRSDASVAASYGFLYCDDFRNLVVRNCYSNLNVAAQAGNIGPLSDLLVLSTNGGWVDIDGFKCIISGDANTHAITVYAVDLYGTFRFRVRNVALSYTTTNLAACYPMAVRVGAGASTLDGEVSGVTVPATIANANISPVYFYGTATLTIGARIDVHHCDFTNGAYDINFQNNTNAAKVFSASNRYRTFPVVAAAITPTGSPFVYQNLDNYRETVIISGGTVSDISIGRNGVTYYTTGLTSGAFDLDNGDYIQVTYTGAPTMTKIPAK